MKTNSNAGTSKRLKNLKIIKENNNLENQDEQRLSRVNK